MNWRGTVFALLCMTFAFNTRANVDSSFLLTATSRDWAGYFPGYLANGYLSTMSTPRGTEGNPGYMVAFMDYQTEDVSRPAAVPGWTQIDYSSWGPDSNGSWLNQAPLDASTFVDYTQTLNMYDATLSTAYRYIDHDKSTAIEVTSFVSEASPHIAAMQFIITPDFNGIAQLTFAIDLWSPHQPRLLLRKLTGEQMQEAVAANNLRLESIAPSTADRAPVWYHGDTQVLSSDGSTDDLALWLDGKAEAGLGMAEALAVGLPASLVPIKVTLSKSPYRLALHLTIEVRKGESYAFTKFVAVSREGWGGDSKADLNLVQTARKVGFTDLQRLHQKAWHALWQADILIDGDENAQRAVHSDLYYLLASSTPYTGWPIGACGLTPGYLGHAFWDSDSWIFPALLLLHPDRAKSLVTFRARTLSVAESRAKARGLRGAMYPWEADPERGTEETPHFASVLGEREIHVNADIAIAQWQYWLATHDLTWLRTEGWPVIRDIAEFWSSRVSYNSLKKHFDIEHVTSVEENYTDIPNDSFTNASVKKVLDIAARTARLVGASPNPQWRRIRDKLYVPFSQQQQRFLDFDESVPHSVDPWGASVLTLLSYPSLDFPMTPEVRRNDYAYAVRPLEEMEIAPSTMGLPPISIAAATLHDVSGATKWLMENYDSALFKPPFNVRSETSENNTGYFITASAGFLQNLLYGLSGLRIQEGGLNAAYAPILPPHWVSLRFTDLLFRGQHESVTIDRDSSGRVVLRRNLTGSDTTSR